MAGSLSADDKLLGEKMHYYCSSSEDEYESCDEDERASEEAAQPQMAAGPEAVMAQSGPATNTGPKGVVADWRRFKQLETEKRLEQEKELIALQKKLSITCRSHLDDEKEKEEDEELMLELDGMDDDFMKEYRLKRLEEMRKLFREVPQFSSLENLQTAEEFLEVAERSHPLTTVIVHIYEENRAACATMNGCLQCLCKEHPSVRFCKILAHRAKLSSRFSEEGVPALLVYKKGLLIGNLVALHDQLGEDFFATDVEHLLKGQSLLPPKTLPEQIAATC